MRKEPGRRSGDRGSGEHEDRLKRANQQLRAEVRQLRKRLSQVERELDIVRDLADSEAIEWAKARLRQERVERTGPVCSRCGSSGIAVIPAGVFNVLICQDCDHRQRVKAR